jgi:DNA-binding winged helix-turn-helix (wHTH) protein
MQSKLNTVVVHSAGLMINPESRQIQPTASNGLDDTLGCQRVSIRLGPINMNVLLALINNHGKVVSRADLFDQVWKNQVVSDDTLTRCISDLRSQLGKLSNYSKLIETIPKQGYRWLAPVDDDVVKMTNENSESRKLSGSINSVNKASSAIFSDHMVLSGSIDQVTLIKRRWILWASLTFIGLVLLSSAFLWTINRLVEPKIMAVALLPVKSDISNDKLLAGDFENSLRRKLLETENIRFLSSRTFARKANALYPYLSREFSVRWIIEVDIRTIEQNSRVVVNIVDARTAIVFDSLSQDISSSGTGIEVAANKVVKILQNNID